MFWFTSIFLALVVTAFVLAPLLRKGEHVETNPDITLYKAQLAEIENDQARGLIEPEEADRTRTEVARRLLAASKQNHQGFKTPTRSPRVVAALSGGLTVLAALGAYLVIGAPYEPDQPLQQRLELAAEMRENRPSQAEFEAAAAPQPAAEASPEYLDSVDQLRALMPTRPDDLRGWQLLAKHELALRNFSAAAKAQGEVIRLSDGGSLDDLVRLIDLMVAAADGQVSPEAESVIRDILNRDPDNLAANYYLGAMHNLTARPDIAFRLWRPIVETGNDTYHTALARAQIEGAAWRAGVNYTVPETRGPSAADIENAQNLTPEERAAMIRNMVAGLADRLATEGGPASDWARLIGAYGVLGETVAAAEIWLEAQNAFATDPDAMATLRAAAQEAGVAE